MIWKRKHKNAATLTLGQIRSQIERDNLHVLDGLGIESEESEIVDWVSIQGMNLDLLVVIEDAVAGERPRPDDVAVGQNQPANPGSSA